MDYPTKCRANVFEGFLLLVETIRGKASYGKTKVVKNKVEEKIISAVCFGSSFLNMVICTYVLIGLLLYFTLTSSSRN